MQKSIYSHLHQALCRILQDARKKSGLTQQQLADQLKRPQSFIAKIERGERRLDVIEFLEIIETLGLKGDQVIRKLQGIKP